MNADAVKKDAVKPAGIKPGSVNQERLMQVLLAPVVSEKSTFVADKNEQVIFRVAQDATKPEIKAAVELLFKVQVKSVQVANVKGKEKRFGRFIGRRRHWKRNRRRLCRSQFHDRHDHRLDREWKRDARGDRRV